jgi:hypothetical protein
MFISLTWISILAPGTMPVYIQPPSFDPSVGLGFSFGGPFSPPQDAVSATGNFAAMPDTCIVAMSGAFQGQYLEVARKLGADATLEKPFTAAQVRDKVAEVLDRRT